MTAPSLYARILGASFHRLPPLLRDIHDERVRKRYSGRCCVSRGRRWIARVLARLARLP